MKRSIFLCIFFLIAFFGYSYAQKIEIILTDIQKQPLTGATLQLNISKNSEIKYKITDFAGKAVFEDCVYGDYQLKISFIGFRTIDTTFKIQKEKTVLNLSMETDAVLLNTYSVVAKRPLIRQEEDKTIIDPEPIANIVTNTLEVLESTPGLYVDPDGGIYLTGSMPAKILINGREQKMSSQDITTILKSLPPNSVEKIELLRTPSVKYDASASGGIINIVLKKGVRIGKYGSFNLGFNQGEKGSRFAGFSYNDSRDKFTSYCSFNYNYNNVPTYMNSQRILTGDSLIVQSSSNFQPINSGNIGYGVLYEINKKNTLSYDGRVTGNLSESNSTNTNNIVGGQQELFSESKNDILTRGRFLDVNQDITYTFKPDTTAKELTVKAGYSNTGSSLNQIFNTTVIFPFESFLSGKSGNTQNRNFLNLQADFTLPVFHQAKIETGGKISINTNRNQTDYFTVTNYIQTADKERSSSFRYLENISAFYAQISSPLVLGFHLKTGFRIEHTLMSGHQTVPIDTGFTVNRTDFFPYIYLSRKVIKFMGIELKGFVIYRRTISRPGFYELNPNIRFVDQFMYESGNPSLLPQFTDNVECNISYNEFPVLAIGINRTTDIFSSVTYNSPEHSAVLVRTYDNLGTNNERYFRAMAGIPPSGKYFFAVGTQYNFVDYNGYYNNNPLSFQRGSWRWFTFHSLTLFGQTKITMNAFLMQKGLWNFYELDSFGQINIGITQSLLNKKLSISVSGRDILKTMKTNFSLNQGTIISTGSRYTDNRRIVFQVRYNFGISKKHEQKKFNEFEQED